MELQYFMMRYLPDMVDRIQQEFPERINIEIENIFFRRHFSEALQNFVDRICKEQRENCTIVSKYYVNGVNTTFDNFFKEMRNAEQPKIEEL